MESESNKCIDVVIPIDAVEVKITSLINPYYIRIYEVSRFCTKNNNLTRMLQQVEKAQINKKSINRQKLAVGDNVIVSVDSTNDEKIDLPDWICRGILTDLTPNTSDVFLLDYGEAINVPTKSLVKYAESQVPVKPFTLTVGLYNIVPIGPNFCVEKDWSDNTVTFIRELFQVSKKTYFQVLANDSKYGKLYGDFFLVIEERNICLSKLLISSIKAVPVAKELKSAVKNESDELNIAFSYQMNIPKDINNVTSKQTKNASEIEKKDKYPKIKSLYKEKILIRSELSIERLEHIPEARFTTAVHKALENNGVRAPKQIQTYMWPAIKKGFDTVAIGTKQSGKTIGYLVPIISCITEHEEKIMEKKKESTVTYPLVLILCSTVSDCINVADLCNHLLYQCKFIKVCAAFNGQSDKTLLTNIINKFNVIISTPPFLIRLLNKFPNKLNFSRLSCVVLDKADLVLEKYRNDVLKLIKNYSIIDPKRQNFLHSGKMQLITVSETWTDELRSYIDLFMEKPYICIGSFIEAAAYCKVKGRMLICHSEKKMDKLMEILLDYTKIKTMLFSLNSEEAIKLNNFLISKSIKTMLVHEGMEITKIEAIKEEWNRCLPGLYPLIICTDQVAFELDISNIEFLIHYTVTNISKTRFNQRFLVFMDHWIQETKLKCKVLIMFDETKDNVHFKGVVNILKRLKVQLPSDWDVIANKLDIEADNKKQNYQICDLVKMFGFCNNSCVYRHSVMKEIDKPKFDISIGDELKLLIIATHSANHFTARLMEVIKPGSKSSKEYPFNTIVISLQQKLKNYFSNSNNKILVKDVVVGKICASRTRCTISRVQILSIVEFDARTEKPKIVRLRSIDDGKMEERAFVTELFELPETLTSIQLPIIEVIMTNIAPFDDETKWTDLATTQCQEWYKTEITSTVHAYAKVQLQIGNCVFTDSIIASRKCKGYGNMKLSSLKDVILKNEHGTINENHLKNLVDLCLKGGLTDINGSPVKIPQTTSLDDCE